MRRLEALHEEMAAQHDAGDIAAELLAAERFHRELCALARMPVLQRMVEGLWLQCGPLMRALHTHALAQPRRQHPHHAVLRGLRKNDGELARKGVEEEIERTTAPILAYLREQAGEGAAPAVRRRAGATA